jgi:hypothetical protein
MLAISSLYPPLSGRVYYAATGLVARASVSR